MGTLDFDPKLTKAAKSMGVPMRRAVARGYSSEVVFAVGIVGAVKDGHETYESLRQIGEQYLPEMQWYFDIVNRLATDAKYKAGMESEYDELMKESS